MRSKRLTILCVAVIALVGTPRAFQEVSKLLAFAQYKAQAKFWSMVLRPREREATADTELIAAAQPWETKPVAHSASGCPLERTQPRENHAARNSNAVRRADSASSRPKARTRTAPASHASLIAKALKAEGKDSLRRSRHMTEIEAERIAESLPSPVALNGAPPMPSESNALRFVVVPAVSPVAQGLVANDTIMQFKLLKKGFEESKLPRQKRPAPKMRNADFGWRI